MGYMIMMLGAMIVVLGRFDLLGLGDDNELEWKIPIIKVLGGLLVTS